MRGQGTSASDAASNDAATILPITHTQTACAGAASAYALKRIAYRAGVYAPGIQERMFYELTTPSDGATIEVVNRWFADRGRALHATGYRVIARYCAEKTSLIVDWVAAGQGLRAAVLPTMYDRLHDAGDAPASHAVAVTLDRATPTGREELLMVDPWPGAAGLPDRAALPSTLEAAHRGRGFAALILFWSGWS